MNRVFVYVCVATCVWGCAGPQAPAEDEILTTLPGGGIPVIHARATLGEASDVAQQYADVVATRESSYYEPEEARAALDGALDDARARAWAREASSAGDLARWAHTRHEEGGLRDALAAQRELVRRRPDDARARYGLGVILDDLGRAEDARGAYVLAGKLGVPEAWLGLVGLCVDTGDAACADRAVSELASLATRSTTDAFRHAQALRWTGSPDAKVSFDALLTSTRDPVMVCRTNLGLQRIARDVNVVSDVWTHADAALGAVSRAPHRSTRSNPFPQGAASQQMLDLLRYSPNPDLGADARACFFDALNEANTYDIAQTQSQFAAMTPANSMSFEDMTIRLFAHERILNVIEKKAGLRGYENRPLHHFVLEADLHHSMYVNFMRVHQVLLGHPSRAGIDSTLQRAIRLDELAIIIAEMRGSSHPALARSYTRLRRLKPGRVIRALPHSSARPDAHRIVWKLEHTSPNDGPNK